MFFYIFNVGLYNDSFGKLKSPFKFSAAKLLRLMLL